MASITSAAKHILCENLCVKKGEKVGIIIDKNLKNIGDALHNEAKKITDAELIEIPIGKIAGEEPPKDAAEKIQKFDVLIIPTTKSLTHTKAIKAALKNARVATMPNVSEATIERAIVVDNLIISKMTHKLADFLNKGKEVHVTTEDGTEMRFSIEGRTAEVGDGFITKKGTLGNLPCGEAYIAPLEGTANGKFVITGSVIDKKITSSITVIVRDGFAVDIIGDKIAEELLNILNRIGDKNAFNIAEFGIGTNPKAKVIGNILEDEKVIGTCHFAFGRNIGFGGKIDVPVHLDAIIMNPTIFVDKKMIMKNGELLL